jgi:hypothetical protein
LRRSLTIGGIEIELSAPKGPLEGILIERYAPFLGPVVDPVVRLDMEPTGSGRGQANPPLAEVRGAGGDEVTIHHPDFSADLDLTGDGTVVTASDPFAVDHFFRVLLGLLAPRHDALMLHSCGVLCGGEAHVFIGPSGAGKSTLASTAGHRPLLSDEHVIVRRTPAGWVGASTPFWGSYAVPGPARTGRLAATWRLKQWPSNARVDLDAAQTLRLLVDNAVLPCADASVKHAVFDVAAALAADMCARELRFVPDPAIWEVIDEPVYA